MEAQSPKEPDVSVVVDPLAEIDRLMQKRLDDEQQSADQSARASTERSEFSIEFEMVCKEQIRPSMDVIIERLRRNGGGGIIVERPEDISRHNPHRLTLWMSLRGEIAGAPREDRNPYLQLDADVDKRCVEVWEGDMGQGHPGSSRKVGEWQLSETTAALVTQEALGILRRSVG